MTTHQHDHGEPDRPAEAPAENGEDLAALIARASADLDVTTKRIAHEAGIPYATLHAWAARTRGTSRVKPETLRDLSDALRRLGGREYTPRRLFEAAGRKVPGPTDTEREKRLLRIYRSLPQEAQREAVRYVETLERISRAS